MHAGPPDVPYATDVVDRLTAILARVDEAGRVQVDRGKALVGALTDQLAAGQAETLYGLQTAAITVRTRAGELERLATQIPDDIGNRVRESVEALAGAASDQITTALETASTRLGIVLEALDQHLGSQQEGYLAVLRESAEATGAQLSGELEEAAAAVAESASRAQASQNAVRAAAVTAVEAMDLASQAVVEQLADLQDQVAELVDQAAGAIAAAGEAFAEEAEGVIHGMTSVGDSFISRMFEVLDERDVHEAALEQRLSDRLGRITADVERRLAAATAAMGAQIDRLEQRDLTERDAMVAEVHDLLRRLLAEPRGKLKDLRNAVKDAGEPVRGLPVAPLVEEPAYQDASDEFEPVYAAEAPRKKAPAKRAPAKKAAKAPAKKAPAKKAAAKRPPASRN
jgi:hypothetical protein